MDENWRRRQNGEPKPETSAETRFLDEILQQLGAQWHITGEKWEQKRKQLLRLLREVGEGRLNAGIQRTLDEYERDFCPPLSFIRTRVPVGDETKHVCGCCIDGWVDAGEDRMGNVQV